MSAVSLSLPPALARKPLTACTLHKNKKERVMMGKGQAAV